MFLNVEFNNEDSDSDEDDEANNIVIGLIVGLCVGIALVVGAVAFKALHRETHTMASADDQSSCLPGITPVTSDYTVFVSNNGRDSSYEAVDDEL
jgi:hypothetical protein